MDPPGPGGDTPSVAGASPIAPPAFLDRVGVRASLSVISGLAVAASFLWFELYPLAWVAFVPLLVALRVAPNSRRAVLLGWLAGVATNLPAFYWLVYTIRVFGGFSYPVALLFYLVLTAFTALQFGAFGWVVQRLRLAPLWVVGCAATWVALEYWFPNLFPWRLANSQMHAVRLLQSGDLAGPFLLSFVMMWFAAGLAELVVVRRWVPLAWAVLAIVGLWWYGWQRLQQVESAMRHAPAIRVGLVQGNVGIAEKGDVRYFEINLEKYRELSRAVQGEVDLLVWPETVHQEWIATEWQRLDGKENPFPDLRTHLIFGGLAYRFVGADKVEQFNSAFWMEPGGRLRGRYDKRILMPFGEYIPGGELVPAVYALSPQTGRMTAGRSERVFVLDNGARIGQLICFEDIVGDMPRKTTLAGANVLVTILNDAWYGRSVAPYQHQALAVWRAVENRRYLLRGSNTGVTSIVDAAGRVQVEGSLFTEEVVRGEAKLLDGNTVYGRVGDSLPVLCSLLVAGGFLVGWWRRWQGGRPGARAS
ncbi:MAG: apolipoprotein N-acyltransferase [Candidatus Binatia bacterium]|nr:MAG: apolipoprotein N-acyltransferase [Candidatus Binatia bacterium]